MKFFDTETCGLHGPIVLLQYADGLDGDVKLHSVWNTEIGETLEVIDSIIYDQEGVVGFNLPFDWFHICQLYNTLTLFPDYSERPIDHIDEIAMLEPKARFGPCIKPFKACDLMLHARKGPYQSTMDRDDIRIKKVPTAIAWQLAEELEKRIILKDIYFSRKKEKGRKWEVYDREDDETGRIDPNFKDVVLKFAASSALKTLAMDALNIPSDKILKYKDVELPKAFYPNELGYAPFALAIGTPSDWNGAWPEKIRHHISHWSYNDQAREYATLDVVYTRDLYKYFGSPELGDDDSELACMVGAVRWKGYSIDKEGIDYLRFEASIKNRKYLTKEEASKIPFVEYDRVLKAHYVKIPTSSVASRNYITQEMSEDEKMIIEDSTKKTILETVAKWKLEDPNHVIEDEKCSRCGCTKDEISSGKICAWFHPAAVRAKEVLEARQAQYEVNFYEKLLLAGRFHASFAIIGALSSRMGGGGSARNVELGGRAKGDGLNPQGVKRTKAVRGKFPLSDEGYVLCGGDFSGFEVCLAEAVYNDPQLREDLMSGKKIHALFGQFLFPGHSYDDIVKSAGTNNDMYEKAKRCFFARLYGGEAYTMNERVGIPIEDAENANQMFGQRYKKVGEYDQKIYNKFCSMRQPGGIGSKVEWHEPHEYAESLLGFRRYFTLENKICKALFQLANDPPKAWRSLKINVMRRDRMQTASGAAQSALFAAAFAMQAFNTRAAKNHEIQATGAGITKMVQRKIWDLQPPGIKNWLVQPMNVHDEIQCPTHPSMVEEVAKVVNNAVESVRPKVPLIKMDWQSNLKSWADK